MKKKIFYGLIILLSVSLLFLGCSTGTSNDSNTGNPSWPDNESGGSSSGGNSAQAKAEASALAKQLGPGVTVEGTVVTITSAASATLAAGEKIIVKPGVTLKVEDDYTVEGELVIEGEFAVAANKTFTVESGGSFTAAGEVTVPGTATFEVADGAAVEVTGTANVEGTFEVASTGIVEVTGTLNVDAVGIINVEGTIKVDGGTFSVADGATGSLDGTINITSGVLEDLASGGGSLWTSSSIGSYVIHPGVKAFSGGSSDPYISGDPADNPRVLLESGTLTMTKDGYEIDGTATVLQSFGGVSGSILVKAGSILTVDIRPTGYLQLGYDSGLSSGMVLTGESTTSQVKITGPEGNSSWSGGVNYGTIYVYNNNTAGYNFYEPNNTQAPNVITGGDKLVPRGTYVWTEDPDNNGSNGDYGWLRQ
jgi:hypothetical protein